MNQLVDQAVAATKVIRVIMQSRCGCSKIAELAASEKPEFIQVSLMVPDGWPQEFRRFKYVGDSQVDGSPVYMEQIDKVPDGYEFKDGALVEINVEDNSN
jgi:hypothetical protein